MPDVIISDDRTTQQAIGASETLYVATSGAVLVLSGPAIFSAIGAAGSRVIVAGEVAGLGSLGTGIDLGFPVPVSLSRAEVQEGGRVTGGLTGVSLYGHGAHVGNDGTISGGLYGVTIATDPDINPGLERATLANTGTITGGLYGVRLDGYGIDGVNSGTISALRATGTGIELLSSGGVFVNTGTINALTIGALVSGDAATFRNGGTIGSAGTAILVSGDPASIENSGLIEAGTHGIEITIDDSVGNSIFNSGTISARLEGIRAIVPGLDLRSTGNIVAGRDGVAISGSGGNLVVDGHVTAGAIGLALSGTTLDIAVGAVVTSGDDGVRVNGDFADVTVTGQVSALGDHGVVVSGDKARVVLSGEVAGEIGLRVQGLGGRISNDGDVLGRSLGMVLSDFDLAGPTDGTFRVINSGLIDGQVGGISSDGGQLVLLNLGTIRTSELHAISVLDAARIINTGLIAADADGQGAFQSEGTASDQIRNYGTLSGALATAGGADFVRNAGLIDGEIKLGNGDDIYDGRGGTMESAQGEGGNDRLTGGALDDALQGGVGRDTLSGGTGNDLLAGGTGRDQLEGGRGEDRFQFQSGDSALGAAQRDIILDFVSGEDVIDLRSFMSGAVFAGTGPLAGGGTRSVRFDTVARVIEGDADGNGLADFQIGLAGGSAAAADFLFV